MCIFGRLTCSKLDNFHKLCFFYFPVGVDANTGCLCLLTICSRQCSIRYNLFVKGSFLGVVHNKWQFIVSYVLCEFIFIVHDSSTYFLAHEVG